MPVTSSPRIERALINLATLAALIIWPALDSAIFPVSPASDLAAMWVAVVAALFLIVILRPKKIQPSGHLHNAQLEMTPPAIIAPIVKRAGC
jgi:threonine/homoserine efflux transporter RhtA